MHSADVKNRIPSDVEVLRCKSVKYGFWVQRAARLRLGIEFGV